MISHMLINQKSFRAEILSLWHYCYDNSFLPLPLSLHLFLSTFSRSPSVYLPLFSSELPLLVFISPSPLFLFSSLLFSWLRMFLLHILFLTTLTQMVGVMSLEVCGEKLISGGDDSVIRIWNTNNWTCEQILRAHQVKLFAVCASDSVRSKLIIG